MKRDMDLVRNLLLRIESDGSPELRDIPDVLGHERDEVIYHVRILRDAGFLDAIDASTIGDEDYMEISLTWQGHEFLENVRDAEIWKKTKEGAKKVGSFSISVLAEIAKAAVLAKLNNLGLSI